MLKKTSLIIILALSLGMATTDFQLAGEAMMKANVEKATYEARNAIIDEKEAEINAMKLERAFDKILIVILACVKITL